MRYTRASCRCRLDDVAVMGQPVEQRGGHPLATGILKDRAAVRAAITQPWSNGQVEAQITKLKLVKRQMYGRAKSDLLEARLLGTA